MNRRQLAKNGFLALCGALLGKKVKLPVESPDVPIHLSGCTEGGSRLMPMDGYIKLRESRFNSLIANNKVLIEHASTEPIPPGWDFLNEPGEDVYDG